MPDDIDELYEQGEWGGSAQLVHDLLDALTLSMTINQLLPEKWGFLKRAMISLSVNILFNAAIEFRNELKKGNHLLQEVIARQGDLLKLEVERDRLKAASYLVDSKVEPITKEKV